MGRVAVEAAAARAGLGRAVMAAAERWASEQGLPAVELHAQQSVIGFYERLGYAGVGEPYEEAGIPHLTMRKELLPGLRPVRDDDSAAADRGAHRRRLGRVPDASSSTSTARSPGCGRRRPRMTGSGELWVVAVSRTGGLLACAGWRPHAGGAPS